MSSIYKGVLTNNGKALIAQATTANRVGFSHIAIGDGNGSVPTPSDTRTALVREKHRLALNSVNINPNNRNQIVCEAIIPSNVGGWTIRELGLYAGSTMVVHSNYPATYKPTQAEGGARELVIRMVINVQSADVIALTLNDSLVYATREWVENNFVNHNEVIDNLTSTEINKPLSANQGKLLEEKKLDKTTVFTVEGNHKVYRYHDVAMFNKRSESVVGVVALKLPTYFTTMYMMTLQGFDYNHSRSWSAEISAYQYRETTVIKPSIIVHGKAPFNKICFASKNGSQYILFGETNTIWSFPTIHIKEVLTHFNNQQHWATGYEFSVETDLSSFQILATPPLYGTPRALTAEKLVNPCTINGVAFDGTRNIEITDDTKVEKATKPADTDVRTLKRDGIYALNNGGINLPTNRGAYKILSLAGNNPGWVHQLAIKAYSTEIWLTSQQSQNSEEWLAWKRLDGADWKDVRNKPTTLDGYSTVINRNDANIVGKRSDENKWFVGLPNSTSEEVFFHSYSHDTSVKLLSNRVEMNKAPYFNNHEIWHAGNLIPARHQNLTVNIPNTDIRYDSATPEQLPLGTLFGLSNNAKLANETNSRGWLMVSKGHPGTTHTPSMIRMGIFNNTLYFQQAMNHTSWGVVKQVVTHDEITVQQLGSRNLNEITTVGLYGQNLNNNATLANNYPVANQAGSLLVTPSAYGVQQEYTTYHSNEKYVRGKHSNNWLPWKRIDGADWSEVRNKPTASLTQAGVVQLNSQVNSSLETQAATPKAVKAAYDRAIDAEKKALPVGSVVAFPKQINNPTGFLLCDGRTFAQATYPDLYRALGNKNKLPQLTRSDVGQLSYFPSNTIPDGWLECNGQTISRTVYPELYAYLGNRYGANGKLPDAEDRFIRNASNGLTVGQKQKGTLGIVDGLPYPSTSSLIQTADGSVDASIKAEIMGADPLTPNYRDYTFAQDANTANAIAATWTSGAFYLINHRDGKITHNASGEIMAYIHRPKSIVFKLCIKARNSFDDVQFWIKAYGEVVNVGQLDASKLANDLRNHTHTVAQISDFAQGVRNLIQRKNYSATLTPTHNSFRTQTVNVAGSVEVLPDGRIIQRFTFSCPVIYFHRYGLSAFYREKLGVTGFAAEDSSLLELPLWTAMPNKVQEARIHLSANLNHNAWGEALEWTYDWDSIFNQHANIKDKAYFAFRRVAGGSDESVTFNIVVEGY